MSGLRIDVDAIFSAIATAEVAFQAVHDLADDVAAVLSNGGQPELKDRLFALRAENEAARERRHEKLMKAADV